MSALTSAQWRERAAQHEELATAELADVIWRRDRGLRHPIDDFLFRYYNLRPSHLIRWHPGLGVALEDADAPRAGQFHRTAKGLTRFDSEAFLAKRAGTVEAARRHLGAVSGRAGYFGCFGMHEWAMVYRLGPEATRHPYLRLRFSPAEVARIVEDVGCRCSHFDAFRFFTAPAKPLNALQPTRESQAELDQPGCLHVNMDLYKWAGKLSPAVGSELLFDTYLLAREIRQVDMQASAYDLREWGYEPIKVETAQGRAQYVAHQREFSRRAEPLRRALLNVVDELDGTAAPSLTSPSPAVR